MYRSCIFCSAALGSNESIERFPIGRSLAFDAERGRLWAVCLRCARWNLAPLEERWEAIDEGERLFRDARTRVQSENIGIAKLRDGTQLIRVGRALAGEMAAWRYGTRIARRQLRREPNPVVKKAAENVSSVAYVVGFGGMLFGSMLPAAIIGGALAVQIGAGSVWGYLHRKAERRVVHVAADPAHGVENVVLRREDLDGGRLSLPQDGQGLRLLLPYSGEARGGWGRFGLTLRGEDARAVLSRLIVHVNDGGATSSTIRTGADLIAQAGSPDAFVRGVAQEGAVLATSGRHASGIMAPETALALEMALHEETERRAMEGELAALEEMWRQAEEIAAIADRLPDDPALIAPRTLG